MSLRDQVETSGSHLRVQTTPFERPWQGLPLWSVAAGQIGHRARARLTLDPRLLDTDPNATFAAEDEDVGEWERRVPIRGHLALN